MSEGQSDTISAAIARLRDADPAVHEQALDVLVRIGEPAVAPLIAAVCESDIRHRGSPARALQDIGPSAIMPIVAALPHMSAGVRSDMIWVLGRARDPRAVEGLIERLSDHDPVAPGSALLALDASIRCCAAVALAHIGDLGAVEALRDTLADALRHRDLAMISAAACPLLARRDDTGPLFDLLLTALRAAALAQIRDQRATEALIAALHDHAYYVDDRYSLEVRHYVRAFAADALGALGSLEAVEPLITVMRDRVHGVYDLYSALSGRFQAARALARIDDPRSTAALRAVLVEADQDIAMPACLALIRRGDDASEDVLIEALEKVGYDGMALQYVNCGNDRLAAAGRNWLASRGLELVIEDTGDDDGFVTWGER
jgi:HEAT repeat protein